MNKDHQRSWRLAAIESRLDTRLTASLNESWTRSAPVTDVPQCLRHGRWLSFGRLMARNKLNWLCLIDDFDQRAKVAAVVAASRGNELFNVRSGYVYQLDATNTDILAVSSAVITGCSSWDVSDWWVERRVSPVASIRTPCVCRLQQQSTSTWESSVNYHCLTLSRHYLSASVLHSLQIASQSAAEVCFGFFLWTLAWTTWYLRGKWLIKWFYSMTYFRAPISSIVSRVW